MLYVGSLCAVLLETSRAEDWFSVPLKMDEIPQMELAGFQQKIEHWYMGFFKLKPKV